jgi:hypothetical protein
VLGFFFLVMKGAVIKREGEGIGPSDSLCLSYGSKLVTSQSVGGNSLNSRINVEAQMMPPISKYIYKIRCVELSFKLPVVSNSILICNMCGTQFQTMTQLYFNL